MKIEIKHIKDEAGNLIEECHYLNGLRHGNRTLWSKDGNKLAEAQYVEGKLNGKNSGWYENGVKSLETCF